MNFQDFIVPVFDVHLAVRFALALALGVLLGLERQHSKFSSDGNGGFAGARTMGLISTLGGLAAYIQSSFAAPWFFGLLFTAIILMVVISYAVGAMRGSMGMSTEIAFLLSFVFGAMCVWGWIDLAVALCITSLLLLATKRSMRKFAQRIQAEDVEATLKFAVITAIVLPLLPNANFGPEPLDVINPYKIWLMVVLISALNFASYILIKFVGQEHGIGLTGLLGGLVSSTAVTLGFAQRSKTTADAPSALSLGILLAWTVMFFRIVIVVLLLSPLLGQKIALVLGLMGLLNLAICFWLWWQGRNKKDTAMVDAGSNPFELGEALKFGLLFGVVIFVAKAAEVYFGNAGLYLASAIAGLTDVDAIALSMANLVQQNNSMTDQAAVSVVIAIIANTVFKTGMVVVSGSAALRKVFLPWALLLLGCGCAALLVFL